MSYLNNSCGLCIITAEDVISIVKICTAYVFTTCIKIFLESMKLITKVVWMILPLAQQVFLNHLLKPSSCRSAEESLLCGTHGKLISAEIISMLLSHLAFSLWYLSMERPVIMPSCCSPYMGRSVYPNGIGFIVAVWVSPSLVLFKSLQFVLKQCFDPWFDQVQLFCVSNFLILLRFVFILGQLLFSSASS